MSTPPAYGPLLDALRTVRWPSRRVAAGSLPGTHVSRLRGSSPEFTEFRPYRQGDDPRRLDWRLLARSDRAYIRLADDRSILATTVVLDASSSLDFPATSHEKWRRACEITIGLAAVAHASGDPVGLVAAAAGGTVQLPPRTRRGVVAELGQALGALSPAGTAPLAPAFAAARGARLALVTDFLGDADALLRVARERIAAGAEVHAVHVVAEEELDPPGRATLATDPEEPTLRRPLTRGTRDAYLDAFARWREELARDWRAAGAYYTMARTGESGAAVVRRIVTPGAPQRSAS